MKTNKRFVILLEIVMIIVTGVLFYPIIMMLLISLKTNQELLISPLTIPSILEFKNYQIAFEKMNYLRTFMNSFVITTLAVISSVVISSMGAYAISRVIKGKKLFKVIYVYFICGLMLPAQLALVTLVFFLKSINLINTIPGLLFVYLGSLMSFSIFLLSGFIKTVPLEIEEAATVDGCSKFKIFWKIVIPLMKPAVITLVIINCMFVWNDFINPLIYLGGSNSKTLPLMVFLFKGQFITQWNLLFSALVLTVLPVIIFYFSLQKYIISGFVSGAVKG